MSSPKTYPGLEQFLGAYFHQDWSLDDPDSASVVAGYLRKVSARSRNQILRELDALRGAALREAQLGKILSQLGSCFDPTSERMTHREWLDWLHGQFAGGTAAARKR